MPGGEIAFTLAGDIRRIRAGGFVPVPDGAAQSFRAIGPEPARLLIVDAPGHRREAFLTRTGRPVADTATGQKPLDGPPDAARILSIAAELGMTIVSPDRDH